MGNVYFQNFFRNVLELKGYIWSDSLQTYRNREDGGGEGECGDILFVL